MNRAVFLDRDGVINKVIIRDGKAFSPQSREEFNIDENSIQAIRDFKNAGFKVIVVTNQPDIARGKLSLEDLNWMTAKLLNKTGVDEVIVCTHDDQDECSCRKPKAGMFLQAARKWHLDLNKSYLVGDGWKDIQAGRAAGCTCILIDAEYNKEVACEIRVSNLTEAVRLILNQS